MSNKKELVKENLEELSKRIGLLIKQYNQLADSEDVNERLVFVTAECDEVGDIDNCHIPYSLNSLVVYYNDSNGWSSSQSCY